MDSAKRAKIKVTSQDNWKNQIQKLGSRQSETTEEWKVTFKDIKDPHSRGSVRIISDYLGAVYPTKADLQFSAFRPVKSTYAEDETIHEIPTIVNGTTNTCSNDGSEFSESDKLHISDRALHRKAGNRLSPLKTKCKLLLMGDSHARGCAVRVKNMISKKFEVCGLAKPGSDADNLTKSINFIHSFLLVPEIHILQYSLQI